MSIIYNNQIEDYITQQTLNAQCVYPANGSRTKQTEKAGVFTLQTVIRLPGAFCIKLVSFATIFVERSRRLMLSTSFVESELSELYQEMDVVTELTGKCVEQNSQSARSQEEYIARHSTLASGAAIGIHFKLVRLLYSNYLFGYLLLHF